MVDTTVESKQQGWAMETTSCQQYISNGVMTLARMLQCSDQQQLSTINSKNSIHL